MFFSRSEGKKSREKKKKTSESVPQPQSKAAKLSSNGGISKKTDHFERGYKERIEQRTDDILVDDMKLDQKLSNLASSLCDPKCDPSKVLDKALKKNKRSFKSGKAFTSLLSYLTRRKKLDVALSVWKWLETSEIERNVFHYNSLINGG